MSIGLIGILVSLAAGVTSMARIAFLLTRRVPVLAHVTRHDYDAALRRFEDGWAWSDGLIDPVGGTPFRNVWARVTYQYGGTEYRNDVEVTVYKGSNPDRIVWLWLDPFDPNRITSYGPTYWLVGVILAFTFGVLFWKLPF